MLKGLWLFLPAYVANMSPVFTAKMIPRWKAPIDGGRKHADGGRILGDGKTWRGLAGGGLFGAATALLVAWLAAPHGPGIFTGWDYGVGDGTAWWAVAVFGGVVGLLALVGDATESYFKRRSGRKRGAPWIPFDQLDFAVFGLLGMLVAAPLLADDWIIGMFLTDWVAMATVILGTVVLHLAVNRIGYWVGLKEVPW